MSAVTSPSRRRPWLIGVVAVWIVILGLLSWWSVRADPPTVQEQRDIAVALGALDRAVGVLAVAATGPDRAIELGPPRVARDCRLTPVRRGVEVTRELTVYVAADQALPVLEEIADGLPGDFVPEVGSSSGGRRVGLYADAGEFVAINSSADANTQVLQISASTGCRPRQDDALGWTDPNPVPGPASLRQVLAALDSDAQAVERWADCPDGGETRTYTVDGVPAPRDLGGTLQPVVEGATVVRAEPAGWAYLAGADSVAVVQVGDALRVSATTPCS